MEKTSLHFFTPVIWFPTPKQFSSLDFLKISFANIAEFYISYGNKFAVLQNLEKDTYTLIRQDLDCEKGYLSMMNGLRAVTFLSLTVVSLQAISTIALKIGNGATVHLFHAIQNPFQGHLQIVTQSSLYTLAALSAVLTAIKIYLHTRKCVVIETNTVLNAPLAPSAEEVD